MQESIGEVAGVLFQVAKYAYEKFHLHDLVFGVYHLAQHHATGARHTYSGLLRHCFRMYMTLLLLPCLRAAVMQSTRWMRWMARRWTTQSWWHT